LDEWFFQLSKDDMRAVLRGLERADGAWAGNEGLGSGHRIFTSSVRFRDEIVHLALLAGFSATFFKMYDAGAIRGTKPNGRPIKATVANWAVNYIESPPSRVSTGFAEPIVRRSTDVKPVLYADRVWCLTMPSGFLITRRALANDKGQIVIASRPVIIGSTLILYAPLSRSRLLCRSNSLRGGRSLQAPGAQLLSDAPHLRALHQVSQRRGGR
jgi:hypothetical protein